MNKNTIPPSLKIFGIRKPATLRAWEELTEARFRFIKPHLDTFTLPRLGDSWVVTSGNKRPNHAEKICSRRLRECVKSTNQQDVTLATNGIFGFDNASVSVVNLDESGEIELWGLTKKGKWVSGGIPFKKNGHADYWSLEVTGEVGLRYVSLKELLPYWKLAIWKELGQAVWTWYERAVHQHETCQFLLRLVQTEDLVMEACE